MTLADDFRAAGFRLSEAENALAERATQPIFMKADAIRSCEAIRDEIRALASESGMIVTLSMGAPLSEQMAEVERLIALAEQL